MCLALLPPFYAHIFDFVMRGSSRRHRLASDLHMLKHTHSAACFPVWGNLSRRASLMHWFNLWMQRECGLAGGSTSECDVVGMCVCVGVRLNGMLMDGKDISSLSVSSQMTFLHVADPQIRALTRATRPDECWSEGVVQGFRFILTCLFVKWWNNENVFMCVICRCRWMQAFWKWDLQRRLLSQYPRCVWVLLQGRTLLWWEQTAVCW